MVTKLVLRHIGPLQLTFIRFLLAFAVMTPFAVKQGFKLKDVLKKKYVLFGLTGTTLYYILQNYGLSLTTVSATTLILSIVPALTTILAVIFLKERLSWIQVVGIFLVTAGVALVGLDSSAAEQGTHPLLGNLLVFGSALSWSIYAIQGRKMVGDVPALVMSTASIGAGALIIAPLVAWDVYRVGLPQSLSAMDWLGILYLGWISSGLTTFLWNYALHYLSASVASPYINLATVIAMGTAFLMGEQPPALQLIGGALTIIGVLLSSRQQRSGKVERVSAE